jgi:hypothetical protein
MMVIGALSFLMLGGVMGFALCAIFAGTALSRSHSELEGVRVQVEILKTLLEEGKPSFSEFKPLPAP